MRLPEFGKAGQPRPTQTSPLRVSGEYVSGQRRKRNAFVFCVGHGKENLQPDVLFPLRESTIGTMKFICYALLATCASAFVSKSAVRPATHLNENFGFDFAEDSYANTEKLILGEANYKQWVNRVNENSLLNRKVRKIM